MHSGGFANGLYTYIFNRAPPLLTQSAALLCPQRSPEASKLYCILESLGPLFPNLVLVIYFILVLFHSSLHILN